MRLLAGGALLVGGTSQLGSATTQLEVQAPDANADALVYIGATSFQRAYSVQFRNSAGSLKLFVAAGTNNFLTGTGAGDTGFQCGVANRAFHIGGTASVVAVTQANALGFHNTTPVAQQSGTGETAGFTANSGTTVNDASTFTGNVGSRAYRISDVVKALKNYGLLASS